MNNNRILFVCTGNICRSPMAEYLFNHHVGEERGWTAFSRGLFAAEGIPASPEACAVLTEQGLDLSPHRSAMVTSADVEDSQWMVCMTGMHCMELARRFPEAADRVRLLTSYSETVDNPDISDPIGHPVAVYRRVRDQIDACLADIILQLMHSHTEKDGAS